MVALFYFLLVLIIGVSVAFILPLPLSRFIKLMIGPALGIIAVTEVTLATSLLLGYNVTTIFGVLIALIVLGVLTSFFYPKSKPQFSPIPWRRYLHTYKWLFILTLFLILIVGFVFSTKILSPGDTGLMTGTGGMWADTALHSAYTMSIVTQGLPPQNPLFAGQLLIYPFLVNLFAANLVRLGTTLQWAFALPQLVMFLGILALMLAVGLKTVGKRATALALLIFFLGWGLGFTHFLQDIQTTGNPFPTQEYTNNLGIFHMHNVLTGLIFPERSFLPGLFIGLLIASFFVAGKKLKMQHWVVVAVLFGILPLWHTHTFLFFSAALAIWLFNYFFTQRRQSVVHILIFGLITAVFVTPVIWWFSQQITHQNFIHGSLGWMNSGGNFLWFWWQNSGFLIPLALIGGWQIRKNHGIFFLPALVMFGVANFVVFQPWDWDNIKLFSWVFFFFALLAGYTLNKLLGRSWIFKMVAIVILISLIFSGGLSVLQATTESYVLYDSQDIELAEWVKSHTQPSDVFLIEPTPNHPVPGLTGRSAYMGYPGQLWVHGINYSTREQQITNILSGNLSIINQTQLPIQYLVVPTSNPDLFRNNKYLRQVFANQKFTLFSYTP